MIRACLSGQKRMTRRIVNLDKLTIIPRVRITPDVGYPGDTFPVAQPGKRYKAALNKQGAVSVVIDGNPLGVRPGEFDFVCPYSDGVTELSPNPLGKTWTIYPGQGTDIWAKETWRPSLRCHCCGDSGSECDCDSFTVHYAADKSSKEFNGGTIPEEWQCPIVAGRTNVSPLSMPRCA
jgi:hypothetical protein